MKELIPCGTKVTTRLSSIEGIVTGISIRFEATAYEISYFDQDMEYKQCWLNESEFETKEHNKFKLGFVK